MAFNSPSFQRRIQKINARKNQFGSTPGLRNALLRQAAMEESNIDYNKMLRSKEFANQRNLANSRLNIESQRLGLANQYLNLKQKQLRDSVKDIRLGTALGIGQLGLQGYLTHKENQRAAQRQNTMTELIALQREQAKAATEFYKKRGVLI